MAKILLSTIQEEAQNDGWQLISDKYQNLKTEMEWQCPERHRVILSYEKWRRNHSCPVCELIAKEKSKNELKLITPKSQGDYRILSLDQATKVTGWAIFQNGELIRHGIYETEGSEVARIDNVRNWVWNMIDVWKIDYVQLEDIQLQEDKEWSGNDTRMSVTVYKVLAHLQGVLENLLYSNNIAYSIVYPATWRNFNKIKGKNKTDRKKNAQLLVKEKFDIIVPLDEAEAICIGLYACHSHSKSTEMVVWE